MNYDQNYINEEVINHRAVLMQLGRMLGLDIRDLEEREEKLSQAVVRVIKANSEDPRRPQPVAVPERRFLDRLHAPVASFTMLDALVWSLQSLLHKQWDMVALDAVDPKLPPDEHHAAVEAAMASVDYYDEAQFAAVKDRVETVLLGYIRNMMLLTVRDSDLTAEDKAAGADDSPVEGPFASYHHASQRLVDEHWRVIVELPWSDSNYHERWAGRARDNELPGRNHLSLGIVPKQLNAILNTGEYMLVHNQSGARSKNNLPDTVYFGYRDHFGIGHSPLDAMAHYLATDKSLPDKEREIWVKWRTFIR